jgi:hypothetical protein
MVEKYHCILTGILLALLYYCPEWLEDKILATIAPGLIREAKLENFEDLQSMSDAEVEYREGQGRPFDEIVAELQAEFMAWEATSDEALMLIENGD